MLRVIMMFSLPELLIVALICGMPTVLLLLGSIIGVIFFARSKPDSDEEDA